VLIASPIYNWSLASTAKTLIEVTGATGEGGRRAAWFDKVITFVCSGGLPHSYMAYGSVAVSMMLDFKCIVNPYMVYATDRDFGPGLSLGDRLHARLERTRAVKVELASALAGRDYRSTWEV
jgi:NAD(P)H-dependent FMN reductase